MATPDVASSAPRARGPETVDAGSATLRAVLGKATLAVGCLGAVCITGPALAAAQDAAFYDTAPLLETVREPDRSTLAERLEAASLDALPYYDLHLAIADDLHSFGLRETLYFTNRESAPLDTLVLRIFVNATPPEDLGPQVTLVRGACLDGVACTVTATAPTTIEVRPSAPLAPGARLRVELDLTGQLLRIDTSANDMFSQAMASMSAMEGGGDTPSGGYGLLAHGDGVASLASFFAQLARREDGAWVTDDHGTTGDLGTDSMMHVRARIVAPEGFVVVTSGEELRSAPVRDAPERARRRETLVHAGAIRDFAVLAGAPLVTSARDVSGVVVRSHYLAGDAVAGRRVLDVACAALEVFERRFGRYPYRELDLVEAALLGGAGGIEFSGLVTVASMFYRPAMPGGLLGLLGGEGGESGLGSLGGLGEFLGGGGDDGGDDLGGGDAASDDVPSSAAASTEGSPVDTMTDAMLEFVTAHEVAHQWWHGLVGSDSRAHPFVDESLAQWSAVLYFEEVHGAERARVEAERQVAMNYVMMRLQDNADAAVDRPASAFTPAIAYAGLVYGKAPFLWPALRTELGDEAFFAGLRAYVERYRLREAPPRGLVEVLAERADRGTARSVRRLAHRWLEERHGDEDLGPIEAGRMASAMLGMDASTMPPGMFDEGTVELLMGLLSGGLGGESGEGESIDLGALRSLLGSGEGEGADVDLGALLGGEGDGE